MSNIYPMNAKDFEDDGESGVSISLVLKVPRDEIISLIGGHYGIVVETWNKCVGNGAVGSKRRKFQQEFNESERRKARKMYNLFYRWYLKTGTPNYWVVSFKNVAFCRRLVKFFGEI